MKIKNYTIMFVLLAALVGQGCSLRGYAVGKVADVLSETGTAFTGEEDPELVRESVPFSLKLVEMLLGEKPNHEGLLFNAAQGFAMYGYAFVQQDADYIESEDYKSAAALRRRAVKLYSRSIAYSRRGLDVRHPGFSEAFDDNPDSAMQMLDKEDVRFLYWYAGALGLKISLSKTDPHMIAKLPEVRILIYRALELDPDWDRGSIYEFLITFEGGVAEAMGGSSEKAMKFFQLALKASDNKKAGPYVSCAESVCIMNQDRASFIDYLNIALAISVEEMTPDRMANIVAQKRAAWLLENIDDFFF